MTSETVADHDTELPGSPTIKVFFSNPNGEFLCCLESINSSSNMSVYQQITGGRTKVVLKH